MGSIYQLSNIIYRKEQTERIYAKPHHPPITYLKDLYLWFPDPNKYSTILNNFITQN